MAAISHACVLLLGTGAGLPALLWSVNRRKSDYIRHQSLQALAYQLAGMLFFIVTSLVLMIVVMGVEYYFITTGSQMDGTPNQWILFLPVGVLFLFGGIYCLIGLVAVVACLFGKFFNYPCLGGLLERYYQRTQPGTDQLSMDQEERLMAGFCHLAVTVPIWGILVPLAAWLKEREGKTLFKLDIAQAVVFQAAQVLVSFLFSLGFIFVMLLAAFLAAFLPEYSAGDSGNMIAVLGIGLLFLFIMMLNLLSIALFQTYGIIAAIQTWKGRRFVYPIIGKWVELKYDRLEIG